MSEPTLTEQELAALDLWARTLRRDQHIPTDRVLRLIEALHAARDEVETLGVQVDWCLRRLPEDVQAEFDDLLASKDTRWDL